MSRRIISALFLLVSSWSSCCRAQWFGDAGIESTLLDNLTRSERNVDAREDLATSLSASAGFHAQPGLFTGLTLSAGVTRTQYRRYSGLSNTEARIGARLEHKFGIGAERPLVAADIEIARNEFNLDLRDADIGRAGLNLQQRVTDTILLRGGLRYEKRNGDHDVPRTTLLVPRSGAVWDISAWTLHLESEFDIGARTWAGIGYQLQDGDIVSTAQSYPNILNTATAITLDPQFGPLTVAYRIPARTHVLSLDLNRAVFTSGTLYAGIEYQVTHGRNDIDYDAGILRAGYIHGF